MQEVTSRLRDTTRGSLYLSINPKLCFSVALDIVRSWEGRKALIRFRLSSHRLRVESGRWHKPQPIPFNERKCTLCNVLEDEFHVVCKCPNYVQLRNNYITLYVRTHCSMHKL